VNTLPNIKIPHLKEYIYDDYSCPIYGAWKKVILSHGMQQKDLKI
jgi:hypothetical protein